MKKILLAAINAKYIHSCLAIRSIRAYCAYEGISLREFSINNSLDYILREIYLEAPDVIAFSVYLWNLELTLKLSSDLKKLLPETKILLGGPEVSFETEALLRENPAIDLVMTGEGEKTFRELIDYLEGRKGLDEIRGIAYMRGDLYYQAPRQEALRLEEIPFVYSDCLHELDNRIIYYEASRGCPFSCGYCLSSIDEGVRYLPLERVFSDLSFFIENKVKQVKFVDRTFNAKKSYSRAIWEYLIRNDNGLTNFHFEISADLLDDKDIEILRGARRGLFQFEIGIQSTNRKTLELVARKTNLELIFENVKKIQALKSIHLHLDLIAALPSENYASFKNSFNEVFSLFPDQLQLGFLKLLKGSMLRNRAEEFGIAFSSTPPYEALYSRDISYDEMLKLKAVEEVLETYYNSGKSINTIRYMLSFFETPFDFFYALGSYWEENSYFGLSHNKMLLYEIIYKFSLGYAEDKERLADAVRLDMFLNDNVRNLPVWLEERNIKNEKRLFFESKENLESYFREFREFTPKQISRMCHLEKFSFAPDGEKRECYILFKYLQGEVISYEVKINQG